MTKPTPAQIEAEVARQGRIANWGHPAAAEVEERKRFVMGAFATPPAAAEVGEPAVCPHCGKTLNK